MENTLEICVASIESALNAQKAGAQRVELCDNLWEGGTTPSAGLITRLKQLLDIDVYVLIRPRGGDFMYTDDEFAVMKEDIKFAKANGVNGIVSGILHADGSVDKERTKELVELTAPLPFTFHRAFDCVNDPIAAMNDIIECGAHRVLTSGLAQSAVEGTGMLQHIQSQFGDKIIVMPGGGISSKNIGNLAKETGCLEWHMTGKIWQDGRMAFKNPNLRLNGSPEIPEHEQMVASIAEITTVKLLLEGLS